MSEWKETELGSIPFGWVINSVGQLIENGIIEKPLDGNHGEKHPKGMDFIPEGIPFIMATDINNGKIDLENCKFLSKDLADSLDKGFSILGDVLLTHKASLGRTAIVKNIRTPYIMLTPQVTYYRVKDKKVLDNSFLKYYFDSPYFQDTLVNHGDSGSTRAYIGITAQRSLPILLPPLAEQKAIAGVLSALDDKIDLLHRQNKTLEAMAEALFRQWFVGPFDSAQGSGAEESWKEGKLGDLGTIITGKTPDTDKPEYWDGELDFITPTDYKNFGKYAVFAMRTLSKEIKSIHRNLVLPKGAILVTCIGSDMGKVSINMNECLTNQQINSIVLKERDLYSEYTYQYLRSIYEELRNIAHGGTTMPIINKSTFSNIVIPIPPTMKLKSFAEITEPGNKKIIKNSIQIRSLEKLRDTLLPKLMSGEVRVEV